MIAESCGTKDPGLYLVSSKRSYYSLSVLSLDFREKWVSYRKRSLRDEAVDFVQITEKSAGLWLSP
jgi:hypothetical protein